MGIFGQKSAKQSSAKKAVDFDAVIDPEYKEELRQIGREHFKEMLSAQAGRLERDITAMTQQVASDLKIHMTRKLDSMINILNDEIASQLKERLREHDRVANEAQEQVSESLSRNAQMVHEKYQQLSINLQRVVADQEVMMATVFEDSKSQISAAQAEQTKVLEQLRKSEEQTRQQADEMLQTLRQTISSQASQLTQVYDENISMVAATRDSQASMIDNLTKTTKALEEQHQQLSQLLDKSLADQKAMVADVINDNMSRIVEHYLVGALGEKSNLREQLPAILEQMEEQKDAMAKDMRL